MRKPPRIKILKNGLAKRRNIIMMRLTLIGRTG